jgi:RNA polymerase sigma factor (sigma-70 family)
VASETALLNGLPDSILLGRLQEAVREAKWEARNAVLGELYQRYSGDLAKTWLRRTSDKELTAEVLQETFTRAITRLPTLPAGQDILIWLRTTARNYWLDRKRHEAVEQRHGEPRPCKAPAIRPASENEEHWIAELDRHKARSVFERYLSGLSARDREILALRMRGAQSPEIRQRLGISEPECRRAYARIRFLLQKMRMRGFTLQVNDLLAGVESLAGRPPDGVSDFGDQAGN